MQLAAQFATLRGLQQLTTQLGGAAWGKPLLPRIGLSGTASLISPVQIPSRPTTPANDTFKLLSAFAGRPLSPIDQNHIRTALTDSSFFRISYRLEDLDQIKLKTSGGALFEALPLQNLLYADSVFHRAYTQLEEKLVISATTFITNLVSPLLQLGQRTHEPLYRFQQQLSEHTKKYSEHTTQIYERPYRDGVSRKSTDKNTARSLQTKDSGLLRTIAAALLAIAKRFR